MERSKNGVSLKNPETKLSFVILDRPDKWQSKGLSWGNDTTKKAHEKWNLSGKMTVQYAVLSIIIWKKYIFEHQSIQSYQLLRMRSRGFNGACLVVLFSPKSLQRTEHLECGSTLISVEFHGRKSFKRVVALVKQRSSYHKQWWWPGHWTAWRPRFPPHKCSWPCRSA